MGIIEKRIEELKKMRDKKIMLIEHNVKCNSYMQLLDMVSEYRMLSFAILELETINTEIREVIK
jgi:hypothetical protein